MRINKKLLILFGFFLISALFSLFTPARAQETEINFLPRQNTGIKPPPKRFLPMESWQTGNQSIRNNLGLRLNTWPVMTKEKIQFNLGPGQILIRIPI